MSTTHVVHVHVYNSACARTRVPRVCRQVAHRASPPDITIYHVLNIKIKQNTKRSSQKAHTGMRRSQSQRHLKGSKSCGRVNLSLLLRGVRALCTNQPIIFPPPPPTCIGHTLLQHRWTTSGQYTIYEPPSDLAFVCQPSCNIGSNNNIV